MNEGSFGKLVKTNISSVDNLSEIDNFHSI